MGIDFDSFGHQEKIEKDKGRGGKDKVKYVGRTRGEQIGAGLKEQVRESNKNIDKASLRVNRKVEDLLGKDKNGDGREIRSYFEWLRLGLICAEEMKDIQSRGNGDVELVWETMLRESDTKQKFVTSSGPGGQNTNKVASAVQLKHLPTGIFVKVQESRDQSQNRERASQLLRDKLMEHIADWETVVGDKNENEVMANMLGEVVKKQTEGARTGVFARIEEDLREGRSL